jgi:hypothetical protein
VGPALRERVLIVLVTNAGTIRLMLMVSPEVIVPASAMTLTVMDCIMGRDNYRCPDRHR